ncbi:MAG: hypothetical protein H6725_06805 [Sandaracinaceae bacterium]|nr:hypothetical protein [Sandaracinaceae bacterium]
MSVASSKTPAPGGLLPLLILSLALGVLVAFLRSALFAAASDAQELEDVYYLPADPNALRTMTLGYREVAADLLWARVLLYHNERIATRTEAVYAMRYVESLVALDPDFAEVYEWAGLLPFYTTVEPSQELALEGVRWVVRGADRFPRDGEMAWDAAATILYELLPKFEGTEAERAHWQEEAVRLSERAVELGGGPPWLATSNATLLLRLGHQDRAARYLEQRLSSTTDPEERMTIQNRIAELRGGTEAVMIEAETRRLERDRERDFPYFSVDEYIVFGPRRMP